VKKDKKTARNTVTENRQARFRYEIIDTYEASLVLKGSEVKSLRNGGASIADSYAGPVGRNLSLFNAYIPEYIQANRLNHEPRRSRQLLLHRREIDKLLNYVERRGMTMVPLRIYFNDKGCAKLCLALARGKKIYEKREVEKKRDWEREKAGLLKRSQ